MELEDLVRLTQQLIGLGEDPEELSYWVSVYPDLGPDAQAELDEVFQKELNDLQEVVS